MGDKSLKQQFHLLQEQQKKRLLKQNEKKKKDMEELTSSLYCSCPDDDEDKEEKFDNFDGVEDELNLMLSNCKDFTKTDDYKDLQETIRELRDENGRLNKLIGEKEAEIKIIRRRWKEDKMELGGGGIGSENAASKIIEFSKKIRELTAELEKTKTKAQTYKQKFESLEQANFPPPSKVTPTKEARDEMEAVLITTKEKLTQVLLKSAEERNEIETLKKEIKIANKVLAREVGEKTSFQSLLNNSSGWRGRQQQILGLQQKVSELQQQLNETTNKPSRNALLNGISHHDEKHRLAMRKIELERKEQQEKMQKELELVTEERNSYKEKNSAARARNKILTQDVKNLKGQIETFVDKGKHDDELVSALLREQQYLKEDNLRLKNDLEKAKVTGERVLRASGNFTIENDTSTELVSKLQKEVKIQEEKVRKLETELLGLKTPKANDRSFIPKPPSANSKKNEKSRRPLSSIQQDPSELQQCETKTMLDAASVENEKLSGLVQVLQRRNEELVQEMLEKDFVLSEQKNEKLKLEKRFEKLSIIQNGSNVRIRGGSSGKSSKIGNNKSKTLGELEEDLLEYETKLSIQMENNDALKDALSTALQAKDDDMRVFHDMIEQTKRIFLQGLRQYKQNIP